MTPDEWSRTADPVRAGMDAQVLDRVRVLCREATECGGVPGLALAVARHGHLALNEAWGTRGALPGGPPATTETIWLVASVTKPVVCAAVCRLVEEGRVLVDDPVAQYLPEFAEGAPPEDPRAAVTVRHLLTHTSGLPDMLPENVELRRRHAPHHEFVQRICRTPLLFPPGTAIRYQSTGIALLGELVARCAGVSCAEFLRRQFFTPLALDDCSLGWPPQPGNRAERLATQLLPSGAEASDWDWNSAYWRSFGAPWGGMYATALQYVVWLQALMHGGEWHGRRVLQPATVRVATSCRTAELPLLPEHERRREAWGFGWRHLSVPSSGGFGDLLSPRAYGHLGATGTVAWNDPDTGVSCALFSNRPDGWGVLGRISSAVAAAALQAG